MISKLIDILGTNEHDAQCVAVLAKHEDTDINAQDFEGTSSRPDSRNRKYFGNTALHFAAFRRLANCVQILLNAGANPNVRNQLGQTPLASAVLGKSNHYKYL